MPNDRDIDAPWSLAGLFDTHIADYNDPSSSSNLPSAKSMNTTFVNESEIQRVKILDGYVNVRQWVFHSHNAGKLWGGTFNMIEYYLDANFGKVANSADGKGKGKSKDKRSQVITKGDIKELQNVPILELGTATGILSLALKMYDSNLEIITSDVDDTPDVDETAIIPTPPPDSNSNENDEEKDNVNGCVEENVIFNFKLNGFKSEDVPVHVKHTWGTGWPATITIPNIDSNDKYNGSGGGSGEEATMKMPRFKVILASDILLYVQSYPALILTLCELMPFDSSAAKGDGKQVFVMSWDRRMEHSNLFFEGMVKKGFTWSHEGRRIFRFYRTSESIE